MSVAGPCSRGLRRWYNKTRAASHRARASTIGPSIVGRREDAARSYCDGITRRHVPVELRVKCFGREAAITVEAVTAADGVTRTVNIDAARRLDARRYDWDDKLVVQVTGAELADVLATLLGLRPDVEYLYHGPRRDKGYRVRHGPGGCAVEVFAAGRGLRRVGLAPAERLAVSALAFRQFQRNHGGVPGDALLRMLELCYGPPATGRDDAPGAGD